MYDYLQKETNRELSKLLHAKGLVSESGYSHIIHHGEIKVADDTQMSDYFSNAVKVIAPAYTLEDVLRRENAINIWGDADKHSKLYNPKEDLLNWEWETTELLRSYQRGFDWMNYIINHLKGEHNV